MNGAGMVLKLDQVSKIYAGASVVKALDRVDFELPRGAFAAIVGPSGSGKSTLLHIASGLDSPSQGEVILGGESLFKLSARELSRFRLNKIGFVFQAYNLFPVLSAVENVEFSSLARGDSSSTSRKRAMLALEKVGLSDRAHFFPNQLSGGQQQRVAVARALASEPQVIFADEPTANLDSQTAHQLIDLFQNLNREFGVTFLFSTHDSKIVDRVSLKLTMQDGRLA